MSAVENPPAFPQTEFGAYTTDRTGMTLRDWFAGQWLAGMLGGGQQFESPKGVAEEAFAVADAMLLARSTPKDAAL